MFDAPYCWCCGEKEHKNGYGCNNPKCKEYYKLKGAKNTEQANQPDSGELPSQVISTLYGRPKA